MTWGAWATRCNAAMYTAASGRVNNAYAADSCIEAGVLVLEVAPEVLG